MPFKSEQQSKWAFATHQPFAEEFSKKTDYKKLPKKVPENETYKSALKKKVEG